MPIYSCEKRGVDFLFLHIPKCGGGSVEQFFRSNGFREELFCIDNRLRFYHCSPQHWHRQLVEQVLNTSCFSEIFAVVRDPVDRMISEYKWRLSHPWAVDGIDSWYLACREAVRSNPYLFDNHFRPQIDFLVPAAKVFLLGNGLNLLSDFILKDMQIKLEDPIILNQKEGVLFKRMSGDSELLRRLEMSIPSRATVELIKKDYRGDCQIVERLKSLPYLVFN